MFSRTSERSFKWLRVRTRIARGRAWRPIKTTQPRTPPSTPCLRVRQQLPALQPLRPPLAPRCRRARLAARLVICQCAVRARARLRAHRGRIIKRRSPLFGIYTSKERLQNGSHHSCSSTSRRCHRHRREKAQQTVHGRPRHRQRRALELPGGRPLPPSKTHHPLRWEREVRSSVRCLQTFWEYIDRHLRVRSDRTPLHRGASVGGRCCHTSRPGHCQRSPCELPCVWPVPTSDTHRRVSWGCALLF